MDPEVAMAREGRLEGGLTNPSPSPKDSGRSTRRRRRSTTARAPHLHHHHHHQQQQQHHNDNGDENDENENENIKSRVVGSSLSWLNNLQHDFPFILPTRLDGSQYEGYLRMESSFPHPHAHPHPLLQHVQLEKGEKLRMEERERACSHSHPARYSPYLCPATTQGGDLLRPHPHHEEWNHVKMGHEEREMDLFWLCVSDLPKLVGQRWRVSSLEGAELKYGPRLGKLLDHHHAAQRVERRLKESRNPLAFFHELHDIVERTSFTTRRDRPSLPLHTFLAVAEDIKGIRKDHAARSSRLTGAAAAAEEEEDSNGDGNGNEGKKAKNHNHVKGEFTCLSDDLSSLEYKTCDDGGREHVLSIRIPPRYPQSPPQVSAIGLPVEFTTPAQAPAPTPPPTPPTTTKVSSLRERDNTYGGCGEDMTMTSSKPKSNGNSNPIREVVCCFEGLVAALQPFWEAMDAIDSRAWVLEPERPDRSCTYRRILLNHHHVSMLVEFSPLQMESAPFTQVSFLGANEHVAPLEERVRNHTFRPKQGKGKGEDLNLNLNLNPCTLSLNKKKGSNRDLGDVVEHLEEMVGMKLPSRTKESGNTMEETTGMMCGICYSYKINQPHSGAGAGAGANGKNTIQVPEIACENKNCGYLFHRECLLEWLQSDQSSRQTFNTMFGSCPYCSDPIVCKRTM